MEKQDAAFSKSIVEIRKERKIKSGFLMFAKFGVEKISEIACQDLKKKEQ